MCEYRCNNMQYGKTNRGFSLVEFKDMYGKSCSLQKSSFATDDCIWLGVDNADPKIMARDTPQGGTGWVPYSIPETVLLTTRMHLSREQVANLLPILQKFVDTGKLE